MPQGIDCLTISACVFFQAFSISSKTSSIVGRPLLDFATHSTAICKMASKSTLLTFLLRPGSSKSVNGRFPAFTSFA
jgi:hypothetical protein